MSLTTATPGFHDPDVPRKKSLKTLSGALLSLAWRESRTARRRLLLYMSSISLGVAALVAIDSFASNVTGSVREQSRALLGGDVAFGARQGQFTPKADSILDSLRMHGIRIARQTTFASMGLVERSGGTRLVQVRAVTPEFPFYGTVTTLPAGRWAELQRGQNALVDQSLLISLDARVGDTLTLGYAKFAIIGALVSVPGDPGISATIGPRVFIPSTYLEATRLLGFGSRADYEAFAKLPENTDPGTWLTPLRPRLERNRVRARTVVENEVNLTESIDQLSDFLGVVGLVALLLGGIGVASGVHAFVARKIDTVAVLRCLGATSRQVLIIYVLQAAVMGLVGAAAGAALGVAIQYALPLTVRDFLPVDVQVTLAPIAIGVGLALGVWVAMAFALRPLLALRNVSPLQALRRDLDSAPFRRGWRDWPRVLVNVALAGSVLLLAASRAPNFRIAVWMSVGIAAVLLVLLLSATVLSALARRVLRAGWPYVVRQGIANLYRPANQTRAVVLSLGFGAFLVTTLYLVQANLLRQFDLTTQASRGNLLFFDVQEDQGQGLQDIVRQAGYQVVQATPIVTMRVKMVAGKTVQEILGDSSRRSGGWAFRREYRSTYRDSIQSSETVVSGKWFGETPAPAGGPKAEVSLEQDVAKELRVKLGDVVTWDVQGVEIPTRVTSLRDVNWARFEPNFFAVFGPGALEKAPKQFVLLTNVPDGVSAARVQRSVVQRYPNVSAIDLSIIRKTISEIVDRVSMAIRFLAVFSLAMGIPVLFSAVAATRRERVREGVLLKTLGATQGQIRRILFAEYALLGVLGSLTGMLLSFGGAWALLKFVFERPFAPATVPALLIAAAMVLVTVSIGVLSGRDVFKTTPMAALREA
ncbi:MAG TPA: FtsX-like permease family protein [Gemmatimonadaceae bacterium]|nr:FtsX-like permease family protein [Gemmatimonadaceae bacterium]